MEADVKKYETEYTKFKQSQAENNPNLHTNIDALISKTQQMQGVSKSEYYTNEENSNNQTELEMKETITCPSFLLFLHL